MLYIVPTPIGNIEDITVRGKRLLEEAEVIIAEDSRVTRKLLTLLEIKNKPRFIDIIRNHNFNSTTILHVLRESKETGKNVVLVTDAGSPGLSDPGFEIISMCKQEYIPYTVLPGANSVIPAVVGSGLVTKEFTYLGFIPTKKGRQTFMKTLASYSIPVVMLESSHRIHKCITELKEYLAPETYISICRELSKLHEEYIHTTVGEIVAEKIDSRGEFVLVVKNQ